MAARQTTAQTSKDEVRDARRRRQQKYLVYPELSFFYGLSFEEIWDMPPAIRKTYHEALPRLVAQEQLRQIQASAFPNMKKSAQRSMTRRLERESKKRKGDVDLKVEQNVQQAAADLESMQIGVQFVDKEGNPKPPPDEVVAEHEEDLVKNA